ncbi:hypothetical protein NPIL_324211, partial [Nephila pilipes]
MNKQEFVSEMLEAIVNQCKP